MIDLGEDDQAPVLELAYAVTVHKAQGSEFGQTLVILPSPCRVLCRELLYDALTRQRDHVTLLLQASSPISGSMLARHTRRPRLGSSTSSPAQSPVEVDGR